ncbi:hypothetical protein H4582DRAFT_364341 [Lactarius indigo]|nr:hypothetical protein H4582DRAFT_364341 [Lactarius indigo]
MGSHRRITTINTLPDNVFVEIFNLCRMDEVVHVVQSRRPWKWHRLAHACRTWRHIMFSSSRYLRMDLFCTHRTPVKEKLGHLPALPIFISYRRLFQGGDQDNLLAALENRDRVRVVELTLTSSLFKELATVMQRPFPALTHLRFEFWRLVIMPPVLPNTFLGGFAPCLQKIHMSRAPFPAAPTLLSSAHRLVKVDLRNIPPAGYTPPEAMVASWVRCPSSSISPLDSNRGCPILIEYARFPSHELSFPLSPHFASRVFSGISRISWRGSTFPNSTACE